MMILYDAVDLLQIRRRQVARDRILDRRCRIAVLHRPGAVHIVRKQAVQRARYVRIAASDAVHHVDILIRRLLHKAVVDRIIDDRTKRMNFG